MALVFAFLYILLLRWIAGPIVFLGIFLAILLCLAGRQILKYYVCGEWPVLLYMLCCFVVVVLASLEGSNNPYLGGKCLPTLGHILTLN